MPGYQFLDSRKGGPGWRGQPLNRSRVVYHYISTDDNQQNSLRFTHSNAPLTLPLSGCRHRYCHPQKWPHGHRIIIVNCYYVKLWLPVGLLCPLSAYPYKKFEARVAIRAAPERSGDGHYHSSVIIKSVCARLAYLYDPVATEKCPRRSALCRDRN